MSTKAKGTKKKAYIVCGGSQGRAVVFGWSAKEPVPGEAVRLTDARMVLYWAGSSGLFGLAAKGPEIGSRLTHALPSVSDVVAQQVLTCTDEAAKAIEAWPVA